jgi:hypothetical protein
LPFFVAVAEREKLKPYIEEEKQKALIPDFICLCEKLQEKGDIHLIC